MFAKYNMFTRSPPRLAKRAAFRSAARWHGTQRVRNEKNNSKTITPSSCKGYGT